MNRPMVRWGLASLAAHALAWLALLFAPGLVGRKLAEAPLEPAVVVLGEGGQTVRPDPGEEASEARPGPAAPEPETPPTDQQHERQATHEQPGVEQAASEPPPEQEPAPLPALVPLRAPPLVAVPQPLPPVVPPSVPPPGGGGRPAVRLGDAGKPPHADLLDPENNRFRKASQDTGNVLPGYPLEAARRLESGTVKLQLFVDPGGRVVNAVLLRSSGSVILDRAARDQALTWRFSPARRDGRTVSDLVEIEIEFKLL